MFNLNDNVWICVDNKECVPETQFIEYGTDEGTKEEHEKEFQENWNILMFSSSRIPMSEMVKIYQICLEFKGPFDSYNEAVRTPLYLILSLCC